MSLLNIFHTGGLTLFLSIVFLGLAAWFGYQAIKAHNSGSWVRDAEGNVVNSDKKVPYKDIPQAIACVALIIAYILIMVFVVAPDYKGV